MKLNLRKVTFWEFDISKMDPEKFAHVIIPRIAMRGTIDEIREMREYYGDEKIKEVLMQVRFLDKITLSLFSNIYDIPFQQFRCYKERQLTPQLWNL